MVGLSDQNIPSLRKEQVTVLFRNAPISILATVINASLLTALEWRVVPQWKLLVWLSGMWTIVGLRVLLSWAFHNKMNQLWTIDTWFWMSIIGSLLTGLGWGASTWFLYPEISLPYELILVFVLAGMSAGSVSMLSTVFPGFLLYNLSIGVPILSHFFLSGGDEFHASMGVMAALFLFATSYSAWNLNRAILATWRLGFENETLIGTLTSRTEAVEQLNRDITQEIQERRGIEEELRGAHDDLECRIAERTADLQRANEELRGQVSERRRAEIAFRSSEERFRHLTDKLNQAVWFVHINPLRVLYISPAAERIWGVSLQQFYKDPKYWTTRLHPDDKATVIRTYLAAMKTETEGEFEVIYRIIRPDGTPRWIHDRCVIHRKPDGRMDRLSGISEDITESRELEDRLRQAQKMQAVGRLAGGIAHDFNNVMTVILGYSSVLLQGTAPDTHARWYVTQIQAAGERCASLTNQLLAFSRKQVQHPVPLDLHHIIRHLVSMLESLIGEHIRIVLQLDPTPRWAKADATQLEQVFINLALNARDAMSHGGTLTIETDQADATEVWGVEQPASPHHSYIRVKVCDTGDGMDMDTQTKIFEPFFTTKPPGRGTGLGLATVHGIVHQSGGTLRVESQPGRGTTMTVYLPEAAPIPPCAAPIPPSTQDKPGTETILLVEDEPSVRLLTRHILTSNGYIVHEAENGMQALDFLRTSRDQRIDLLVTDMVMPGLNGQELATQLRSSMMSLKVLFVSGYSDRDPLTGDAILAQTGFLRKPFTPDELIKKVREILHVSD
ncbi:MAG: ATP-binding protein [Nitrospiraceae bacterium]